MAFFDMEWLELQNLQLLVPFWQVDINQIPSKFLHLVLASSLVEEHIPDIISFIDYFVQWIWNLYVIFSVFTGKLTKGFHIIALVHRYKISTGSFPGKVFCCTWKSSWTAKSWFSLAIWPSKFFFFPPPENFILKGCGILSPFLWLILSSLMTLLIVPLSMSITIRSRKLIYRSSKF